MSEFIERKFQREMGGSKREKADGLCGFGRKTSPTLGLGPLVYISPLKWLIDQYTHTHIL